MLGLRGASAPTVATRPVVAGPTLSTRRALHALCSDALQAPTACSMAMRGTIAPQRRRMQLGGASLVVARGSASGRQGLHLPLDRDLEQPIDGFTRIEDALEQLRQGKFLVVLDDESRENEGDLIIAADMVTPESMHFMVEYTSGVVCIAMEGKDLDRLKLPLMVRSEENEDTMYTAFTITVDLREGITTGISATDRANTLRQLANPRAVAGDFRRPGHIFPLRYRPGGVLIRPGHTEASVDLARLAGCFPAGALSEIVNKQDGSMSRTPDLLKFAAEHKLACITIADLMRYRLRHEKLVTLTASAQVASRYGPVTVHTFKCSLDGTEHIAVVVGEVAGKEDVMVHVQQAGSLADLLGCAPAPGQQADDVLARLAAHGKGVSVYMQQAQGEAPTTLAEQVQRLAAHGQASTSGDASVPAAALDLCDYGLAAQVLKALQVNKSVYVATNDQDQQAALKCCGIDVRGAAPGSLRGTMNGKNSSRLPVHA